MSLNVESESESRNVVSNGYFGICSPEEAESLALDQLGVSACGATAVLSAAILSKLFSKEMITQIDSSMCILRRRAESAPLPQYLLSRHNAGCTGEEVAISFNALVQSNTKKTGQFLSDIPSAIFLPFSDIALPITDFLRDAFQRGQIVIATLNLQVIGNDAWHHQLVYGVDTNTEHIFLMNPLETCHSSRIKQFLSTPSVLFVRRSDVLSRYDREGADYSIFDHPDWANLRVREQIERMRTDTNFQYVVIPAAYIGGFTIINLPGR